MNRTHLAPNNVETPPIRNRGVTRVDLLAATPPKVDGPGWGKSPGHKANVRVVVVEGGMDVAVAVLEVHVLALCENHDEELDREALEDRLAPGGLCLSSLLLFRRNNSRVRAAGGGRRGRSRGAHVRGSPLPAPDAQGRQRHLEVTDAHKSISQTEIVQVLGV